MAKVLHCITWNEAAQTCTTEAWVDEANWTTYLPTVDQATAVGSAYFVGLMTLAVVRGLLNPKNEED
jgi:hypothetical protein